MRTHFENLKNLFTPDSFSPSRVGMRLVPGAGVEDLQKAFSALLNSEETGFDPEEKKILIDILCCLAPYFDVIETAESALKKGNSYLDLLIKAHERGIVIVDEIYEIVRRKLIGLYLSRTYYMSTDDYYDLAGPLYAEWEVSSFTQAQLDQKLEKFSAFLGYLNEQAVSLAQIQLLCSQIATITYYYQYTHDFISFLSRASGSVILAYITKQFLNNDALIQLAPVAEKIATAIRAKEASDAFTLIQTANDRESPLGRYFMTSWATRTQLVNLNRLLTTHCAAHTMSLIRDNSFPAELLAKVAADKAGLVTHLTTSASAELLFEALNPETSLGQFFRRSGGIFDFTTPWCLAELEKALTRRSSVVTPARSSHGLFAPAPASAPAGFADAISASVIPRAGAGTSINE